MKVTPSIAPPSGLAQINHTTFVGNRTWKNSIREVKRTLSTERAMIARRGASMPTDSEAMGTSSFESLRYETMSC